MNEALPRKADTTPRIRLAGRLREALPSSRTVLAGMPLWGLVMGASAMLGLWVRAWETPSALWAVVALFAAGGALAFPVGLCLARLVSPRRRESRFAATFLALAVATIGLTSGLYVLVYRTYYATWHADAFTITWVFQQIFTTLGALGQFAVLGLRLYFPVGFAALVGAALLFSRPPR